MLQRRAFLTGLVAAPLVVSSGVLMPLRGLVLPPIVTNNSLLTMEMITREAVRLFKNSNTFVHNLNKQYEEDEAFFQGAQWHTAKIGSQLRVRLPTDFQSRINPEIYGSFPGIPKLEPVSAPVAAVMGVAAVATKNPVVSRRFWSWGSGSSDA